MCRRQCCHNPRRRRRSRLPLAMSRWRQHRRRVEYARPGDVTREVARQRVYPHLVYQKGLSPETADLELSQMRSVQAYLLAKLQAGELPQQQVLF